MTLIFLNVCVVKAQIYYTVDTLTNSHIKTKDKKQTKETFNLLTARERYSLYHHFISYHFT